MDIVFGPVVSRRLGLSLGVNNIFYKYCTYTCVYCQAGRTTRLTLERRAFYEPSCVVREVVAAVSRLERLDYVTFVPDGEPTLDVNLGAEIGGVKEEAGIRVAVISNSSLLWRPDVREDLSQADYVSVKVDAVGKGAWRRVNRPHGDLKLDDVLRGILEFSGEFEGTLTTETMLVRGVNDSPEDVERVACFLREVNPDKAYIAVPVRPPAERWVSPPSEATLNMAYQAFSRELGQDRVELLLSLESGEPSYVEDPIKGLVATTAVHPVELGYAEKMLSKAGLESGEVIGNLVRRGVLAVVEYEGHKFLVRKITQLYKHNAGNNRE